MLARHDGGPPREADNDDIWAKLAAPLPPGVISWRQDGKPIARDGRYLARFVAYIEAGTVRERLDAVVPGEWNLMLELLPTMTGADGDGVAIDQPYAFKARLQVVGAVREDVGHGKDYKQASTDAFKRAAVRFGIGHELYDMGLNWVQMDGDGKYAKAIEDPQVAYERRQGRSAAALASPQGAHAPSIAAPTNNGDSSAPSRPALTTDAPNCPQCGGKMWDNRDSKKNPKAPDFKCRDRSCDGVVWPPKPEGNGRDTAAVVAARQAQERADALIGRATGTSNAKIEDEIPF